MNGCGRARWTWPFCSYHENSQNHWIPFLEDEIWAVVPDGHPLAGCEELSLAQLASEPFILEDRAYDYDISRVIQEAGVHPQRPLDLQG